MLLQSFDDPLVVRGVAPPGQIGHSYGRLDRGLVHVDVALPAETPSGEIAIRVIDLSRVRQRPTEVAQAGELLARAPRSARIVAEVFAAELTAHPDWSKLGLPGGEHSATGRFEIYMDRAGKYRWRLRRPDGQIVGDSGQGYRDRAACEADLRWIREHASNVPVQPLDLT